MAARRPPAGPPPTALVEAVKREEKLTIAGANPALIKGVQKSERQMKRQEKVCKGAVDGLRDKMLQAGMEAPPHPIPLPSLAPTLDGRKSTKRLTLP